MDFEIGQQLAEDVIPGALDYYLGLQQDDGIDEEDDDLDEGDDDEDDEDDDE